jgi:DmsE family decaheme c-type cytochrome
MTMKHKHTLFTAVLILTGLLSSNSFSAEEAAGKAATAPATEGTTEPAGKTATPTAEHLAAYTKKGADTCIKCHDEDSEFPVFSIFKTKHAQEADKRSPFAHLQCETCHGPGANHAKKVPPGENQAPIIAFGPKSKLTKDKVNPVPVAKQNKMCLNCHQGNDRIGWHASTHGGSDLACASCHRIHVARDPVLSKANQPGVCYSCHTKVRADFYKTSTHPVRAGLMACSDCHKPHGSSAEHLLIKPTVNQTCYTCHAEKRGPFLWEHAPVTEDCTLCHTPHGSVYPALLSKSPPLLCQQCHSVAGHPAVARTGAALPGGSSGPSAFLLVGSCTNCHSQVHGTNHPSGVRGMR